MKIYIEKLYEVSCEECGMIDASPFRKTAELAARTHRELNHRGEVSEIVRASRPKADDDAR